MRIRIFVMNASHLYLLGWLKSQFYLTLGKSLLYYFTEILLFTNYNDALIICVPKNSLTIIK